MHGMDMCPCDSEGPPLWPCEVCGRHIATDDEVEARSRGIIAGHEWARREHPEWFERNRHGHISHGDSA
jgi:hypothetical protein